MDILLNYGHGILMDIVLNHGILIEMLLNHGILMHMLLIHGILMDMLLSHGLLIHKYILKYKFMRSAYILLNLCNSQFFVWLNQKLIT